MRLFRPPFLVCLLLAVAGLANAQFPGEHWEELGGAEAKGAGWSRQKLKAAREFSATLDTEAVVIVVGGKVLGALGGGGQEV